MKFRKAMFRLLLVVAVFCTGSLMTKTVEGLGCTQFCANGYNACMLECNGDAACQHSCYVDWECCKFMCDGSGVCQ